MGPRRVPFTFARALLKVGFDPAVIVDELHNRPTPYAVVSRLMGWAAHGDKCGGFPGVSNEDMRGKVERAMKSRADEFPEAEHFALFAHGGGVEVVARQAPRGTPQ